MEVKEPADGQWGRQMENGSWTGVVPSYHTSHNSHHRQLTILHAGRNGGQEGGRPLNGLVFDWSPGEGGGLLGSLHGSVSFRVLLSQTLHQMNPSHFRSHHPCLCHRFKRKYFAHIPGLRSYTIRIKIEKNNWVLKNLQGKLENELEKSCLSSRLSDTFFSVKYCLPTQ